MSARAAIPELLTRLQALVPSWSSCFLRMDAGGGIIFIHDPCPEALGVIPLYASEFYDARECEVMTGFSRALRTERGVRSLDDTLTVSRHDYFQHDFYNLIFRPMGYRDFIRVVLREQGAPLGVVAIHRGLHDPQFSRLERRRLAAVAPFIAHAVAAPEDATGLLVAEGSSALIIADAEGRIRHMSAQARRLLRMCAAPASLAHRGWVKPDSPVLPPQLRLICRRLHGMFCKPEPVAPPVWQHRNAWGGFDFRAYWLHERPDEVLAGITPLIGITVQYQVPLRVKLMRRMQALPLSNRQKQVCLLLAEGRGLVEIADRLGIKRSTADYHRQQVYARIEVHTRSELLLKLIAL